MNHQGCTNVLGGWHVTGKSRMFWQSASCHPGRYEQPAGARRCERINIDSYDMRLTPLDIKKQDFERSFRGFDVEEVRAFLTMVANQWEEGEDERRRLEDRVQNLENKMEHYERVEEALQEALQTARESSEERLENAERKAAVIIEEAKTRGDEIRSEARQERNRLHRQIDELSSRRNELAARLRAFLSSEIELLEHFEDENAERGEAQAEGAASLPEATTGLEAPGLEEEPMPPEEGTDELERVLMEEEAPDWEEVEDTEDAVPHLSFEADTEQQAAPADLDEEPAERADEELADEEEDLEREWMPDRPEEQSAFSSSSTSWEESPEEEPVSEEPPAEEPEPVEEAQEERAPAAEAEEMREQAASEPAPEEPARPAGEEAPETSSGAGWIVRPVVSNAQQVEREEAGREEPRPAEPDSRDQPEAPPAAEQEKEQGKSQPVEGLDEEESDELEKIRRILKDLE